MTGTLVQLLRTHFTDVANITDPALRDCLWVPGPATGIAIESIDQFTPTLIETTPAIIIQDHAIQIARDGIAGLMQGYYSRDGQDRYCVRYNCSITCHCIAGASKAAKKLATEVMEELIMFSEPIRQSLGLIRFIVLSRDSPFILEESSQHTSVPITIAYQVLREWMIELQGPRIKRFLFDIKAHTY